MEELLVGVHLRQFNFYSASLFQARRKQGYKMKKLIFICLLYAFFGVNALYAAGIADLHKAKGLECAVCHGSDIKNLQEPTIETCAACHSLKTLAESSNAYKPTNPHKSPHYQENLDCNNCHHGHQASEDYCAQCHSFNFKVK